jgi:hypothetical protein
MKIMGIQSRISVTLSPRMRKALELAAGLEGSTTASFATQLLTQAIKDEIKDDPILSAKWIELEKQALTHKSWDKVITPVTIDPSDLLYSQIVQKGWFLSGDNPDGYLVGKDKSVNYKSKASGYIRSKRDKVTGFGTIMQQTDITEYLGRKLEYSAVVRTNKVSDWAGLWVRLDDSNIKMLWFDNMQNRPITGTTDWKEFHIAFDVPKKSQILNFGILIVGSGCVWINNASLIELKGKKKNSITDLDVYLDF